MLLNRHFVAGWLTLAIAAAVCSAQTPSMFGSDTAARAVHLEGQVSVLKDSTPWALSVGSEVYVRQVILTGADGYARFQVSDGSTFEVFPNSRVTFRANPANLKDLLDLWLGRVKVHIEKLSGQPNHNRVKTPTAVISVRGTIFDVTVEDENSTLVAVEEGLVAVEHAILPSKTPKLVNPGESLRIDRFTPLARVSPQRDAVLRQVANAIADAIYRAVYRTPSASGGSRLPTGGSGGGTQPLPGETEGGQNPPPPPPPPPPAPPL